MASEKKSSVGTVAAILLVVFLVAGAVFACVVTGDNGIFRRKKDTPEQETTSDGEETKSDGDEKQDDEKTESDGDEKQEEIEYVEGDPSYFWLTVPKTTVDPDNPLLILVNSTHAIPDGYVDTITLQKAGGYNLDSRAATALKKLIAAAEKDGIKIRLCSGFRTHERQIELYTNRIKTEQKNDKTLTWKEACLKAARTNALPGTSEHETGLCWDYSNLNYSFDTTEEFAWLNEHAEEYGFVLRYPKDKQDITGIIYEPWHWRYVGVEHAKAMNDLGMCLEEYVEYLADKK